MVFLASVAVAAAVALAAAALLPSFLEDPGVAPADVKAHRVTLARGARLTLFFAFLVSYAALGRRIRPPFLQACGFATGVRPLRLYAAGFLAGAIPVVLLIAGLTAWGAHVLELRTTDPARLSLAVVKPLLTGVLLVLTEDTLFSGLILGDLVRAFGRRAGLVACATFFAATHFLGPPDSWKLAADAHPGPVDVVAALFRGVPSFIEEWPRLVGLVLVGLILSTLRLRSGHLYLTMGVHAGWFWVSQVDRWFVDEVDSVVDAHRLWIGTNQYLDGVLGWAALLATWWAVLSLRSPTSSRSRTP